MEGLDPRQEEPQKTGAIRNEKGQFVPGVTGNPNGRPKGSFSLVEMIKHKLQEVPEGKDKTYAEYFIEQLMKKSITDGDTSLMKDMINRVDGMPRQTLGLDGGEEGKPITVTGFNYILPNDSSNDTTTSEATPSVGEAKGLDN